MLLFAVSLNRAKLFAYLLSYNVSTLKFLMFIKVMYILYKNSNKTKQNWREK